MRCFEVEGSPQSQTNLGDGTITMENSFMACSNGENFKYGSGDVNLEDWFLNQQSNNQVSTSIMLGANGQPMANSPLLGAGQDVANTLMVASLSQLILLVRFRVTAIGVKAGHLVLAAVKSLRAVQKRL